MDGEVAPHEFFYKEGTFIQESFEPHDVYEIMQCDLYFGNEKYLVRRLRDDWYECYELTQIEPANAMEVLAWQLK